MKTPDEIKKGLECCGGDCFSGNEECPYDKDDLRENISCIRWMAQDALAYIHQLVTKCHQLERERDAAIADLESVDEKYESLKRMIDDVTFNHEPYGLYLDFREAADAMVEHEHADVWCGVKDTRTGASDSCTGASGV